MKYENNQLPLYIIKRISNYYSNNDCFGLFGMYYKGNAVNKAGFTKEEQVVSDFLIEARNAFVGLEEQHPNDRAEFDQAIHVLQGIMAIRILRRDYPKGWATYRPTKP